MALYVMPYDLLDAFKNDLKVYDRGKSCIRFKRLEAPTFDLFDRIIKYVGNQQALSKSMARPAGQKKQLVRSSDRSRPSASPDATIRMHLSPAYFVTMSDRTVILDHEQVQRKLRRIAHQLHEEHHAEKNIVIVGVAPRGATLAKRLATLLGTIAEFEVELVEMQLDKDLPLENPCNWVWNPRPCATGPWYWWTMCS
ncbi:MAG: hypothetical protein IPG92_17605 [Flavobacteriales bacterium]|nr:hypothetical protein [Flavobacteriales bacterium]